MNTTLTTLRAALDTAVTNMACNIECEAFEKYVYPEMDDLRALIASMEAQPEQKPVRHVGDSQFESWYGSYVATTVGLKQQMRDAYAAGMSDPAQPEQRPVAIFDVAVNERTAAIHYDMKHGLKSGDKLYTHPAQPASEPKAEPTQLDAPTAYKLAKQYTVLDAREDGEAIPEDAIWEFAQAILRAAS